MMAGEGKERIQGRKPKLTEGTKERREEREETKLKEVLNNERKQQSKNDRTKLKNR